MGFRKAISTCFRNYATFSGRASRAEYWWFFLFCLMGNLVAGVIDNALFRAASLGVWSGAGEAGFRAESDGPVGILFSLAVLLPSLAAGWRRMHDTGRSGLFLVYPLLVMLGISVFMGTFGGPAMAMGGPASGLAGIVLAVSVLVLILSPLLVLWWLTRPSQPGNNTYGPNPHEVLS